MARTLILLRGINVSGRNKVPMAELRDTLTGAGFDGVATYIQSGNIAVDSDRDPDELCDDVESLLVESFGVEVPAVALPQSQLGPILDAAPFASDADPAHSLIYFPRGAIDTAGIEGMEGATHPRDSVWATEQAVYVAYGQGQSKSKLTVDKLERAAGTTLTGRNLRSVAKLQVL